MERISRRRGQKKVQLIRIHHFCGLKRDDLERDQGIDLGVLGDTVRDNGGIGSISDLNAPLGVIDPPFSRIDPRIEQLHRLLCILGKLLPGLIQHNAVADPVKQLDADLPLQRGDVLAQRRLGDMEQIRRGGDMLVFGQMQKILDVPNVHSAPSIIPFLI